MWDAFAMNQFQALRSTDPAQRRQAIAQLAREDNNQALVILRQIQQNDPVPSLRAFAAKAIERMESPTPDFMANLDKRQKRPAMPSPFVEEIVQLTPAAPRPTPRKRSFTDTLSSRPTRQYSDDPEQYESSTPRYIVPLVLAIVLLMVALLGVFLFMPK
jgi:HEAT repeat protein